MLNTPLSYTHCLQKSIMSKWQSGTLLVTIMHMVGLIAIEMLCLNDFDLVPGNPTLCAMVAALFSL